MKSATIFSQFLESLDVPHTRRYSDMRYHAMQFKSLFGFSRLLTAYGIESRGLRISDKNSALDCLQPPFLAQRGNGFVIVDALKKDKVWVNTDGKDFAVSRQEFIDRWTGVVLQAFPGTQSIEPDYRRHRFLEIAGIAKKWALGTCIVILMTYLFVSNRIWSSPYTVMLMLLNSGGIYITYLLLLKSLKIDSHAADKMCGAIQAHGCDTVLQTSAAKFFGLFGWSEVGSAYFGVSLATLMVFPQYTGFLAAINLCCLPFSFWSIWYQKTRAKAWCMLCLTVQALLWASGFCYLCGGFYRQIFPLDWQFFMLAISYLTALLTLNKLMPSFNKNTDSAK